MPQVKQSNKINVIAVFEDPRPAHSHIYLFGDGHNKQTLAPIFDLHLKLVPNSGAWNMLGWNNNTDADTAVGYPGYGMALTKQTTHVMHTTQTGNNMRTNVDISWGLSMDPNNQFSPIKHWTDGTRNQVTWNARTHHFPYLEVYYNAIANGLTMGDTSSSSVNNMLSYDNNSSDLVNVWGYCHRDPGNDFISGIYSRVRGSWWEQRMPPSMGLVRANKFPTYTDRAQIATRDYVVMQYIGASTVDGRPIYLANSRSNDRTQTILRHNTDTNTETALYSFSAVPSAVGVSYGGDRSVASGLRSQTKMSSRTFTDPAAATTRCWYTPYFDSQNNYCPFLFRWNTTNDVFTRSEVTNITGDLSSTHLNSLHGCQGDNSGLKSVLYNETFVLSGTRYVSIMPIDGGYQVNDANPLARTIVTYSVDAANPALLTYHSKVVVPSTIKNIVWLNDARTLLGVFTERSLLIYNFTSQSGWVATTTVPNQFWAVGRDSTDRIWGLAFNATGYVDVHVITAGIPVRITVTPASSTYNYQGTNINSTVNVSAYDISGNRIATNVNLSIVGSTMTFAAGATSTTVNTSSSAETSVPIIVTGAGQSDIVASVQL